MVKLTSIGVIAVLATSCTKPRVVSFDVTPTQVCKDQEVTLTWEVVGRATLQTAHGSDTGTPEPITTKSSRTTKVSEATTFTIMALDADRSSQDWIGEKTVSVTSGPAPEPHRVTTQCDASRHCTGVFTMTASPNAKVSQLSSPTATSKGLAVPATVCVTHGSLKDSCVPADHPLVVSELAAGDWTLSTTLAAGTPTSPAPALTVILQLGCQ